MLISANEVASGEVLTCDVCIVGAGAAGIAIAQEFENTDIKVLLLESGGLKPQARLEDLNRGEVSGEHHPLERYRSRHFGGTTSVWGGRCVPFDAFDFEERDCVPHSGWPIDRDTLLPYYRRAHDYLDLGAFAYSTSEMSLATAFISGFSSDRVSVEPVYLFSKPTDLGKKYYSSLKRSCNVKVLLEANGLACRLDEAGSQVERLIVAAAGRRFEVAAQQFVLAAGGLEVTRLLLASNEHYQNGIGNGRDLLGRFYMGHLNSHVDVQFEADRKICWDYERTEEGVFFQRAIALSEAERRRRGLLNQRAFVERPDITSAALGSSVLSATYLAKGLVNQQKIAAPAGHVKNILLDTGSLLGFSRKWITQRILSERKLPSAIAYSPSNRYTLRIDSEQTPNFSSRVALSSERDEFGMNRLKVDWRYRQQDIASVQSSVAVLGETLLQAGAGRLCSELEVSTSPQGGHHLGTTRMSNNPKEGVVNEECRVHDVANLYIASSSVFVTSSYANPTLTIVAIAIRLADRIRRLYGR